MRSTVLLWRLHLVTRLLLTLLIFELAKGVLPRGMRRLIRLLRNLRISIGSKISPGERSQF